MLMFKLILAGCTLSCYMYMLSIIILEHGTMKTLDTDFTWTIATAHTFLRDHTKDENISRHILLNQVDTFFPFLYAPLLYLLTKKQPFMGFSQYLSLFAGIFDIIENNAIRQILLAYPNKVSETDVLGGRFIHLSVIFKFLCLGGAIVLLIAQYCETADNTPPKKQTKQSTRCEYASTCLLVVVAAWFIPSFFTTATATATSNSLLTQQRQAWDQLNTLYTTYERHNRSNSTMEKGHVTWDMFSNDDTKKHQQHHHHTSSFYILKSLLSRSEVSSLLTLLKQVDTFDLDLDTVDQAPTYEFYLEKNGHFKTIQSIPGKIESFNNQLHKKRLNVREKIAALVRPILQSKMMPLVKDQYRDQCSECEVCWSFVRRYKDGERLDHGMHFDLQALVTVVVSLSDFGLDFSGGLYVSAKNDSRLFLPLMKGDAVMHQSDLLHGVRVTKGDRWSWVMWLKEKGCESDPSHWEYTNSVPQNNNLDLNNDDDLLSGSTSEDDPISLFLRAKRTQSTKEKMRLFALASEFGFGRAANELGMLYKESRHLKHKAKDLFLKGTDAGNAESMYNLANIYISESQFTKAVHLFHRAASLGNALAMFNVGVANLKGAAGLDMNVLEARKWFVRCGTGDGDYAVSTTYEKGTMERRDWLKRASMKGHAGAIEVLKKEEQNEL